MPVAALFPTDLAAGWLPAAALFGLAVALLAPIAGLARWQSRGDRPPRLRRAERRAAAAELTAHSAAVAARITAAGRESAAAYHRLSAAERARADAWATLERLQEAHGQADRTLREVSQRRERGADPAAHRTVAHAALAAYRRGDLAQEEYWRVWRWANGWDPEHERWERELARLRAALRTAQGDYRTATAAEQVAQRAVEVAEVQVAALTAEADEAAAELARVRRA